MESGLDDFADYEVIELLLTLASPRVDEKNAGERAYKTVRHFERNS